MTRPSFMPEPNHAGRDNRLTPVAPIPLRDADAWDAMAATEAPRVPWDVFARNFEWAQGEHVACIGMTGQGKTTLLRAILPSRRYVVIFGTKPVDENLERLQAEGYDVYTEWQTVDAEKSPRRLLWPDARTIDAEEVQKEVFSDAMGRIYREGGWCVAIDEGWYLADPLKLAQYMRTYWTQGRSLRLSFVVCTQRPAWVPLEMYSESTHLFFWRTVEESAVKRISNLGGANEQLVKYLVRRLERHQFLYVNKLTGDMMRSRAPYFPPTPLDDATPNAVVRR